MLPSRTQLQLVIVDHLLGISFNYIILSLGTTLLSVGPQCKRCCGLKMEKRNGGLNPMYQKTLRCHSNSKLLDGEYATRRIVRMDLRKACRLPFMMNWSVGRSILMDAYVIISTSLMIGGARVSPDENMVATGTVYASIYHLSQIRYQRDYKVYYHGIYWNIL